MRKLLSLPVALVSLALSAAFDQIGDQLMMRGAVNITAAPNIWLVVLLEAAFIASLLASAWVIAVKAPPPAWMAGALLLVGLAGALYLPLMSSGATFLIPSLSGRANILRKLLFQFRPGSFFAFQCISLSISAAVALTRQRLDH